MESPKSSPKLAFIGKVRNAVMPYALPASVFLGSVAGQSTQAKAQFSDFLSKEKTSSVAVDNFTALLSGRPLRVGDKNITRDANGTLVIPYCYEFNDFVSMIKADTARGAGEFSKVIAEEKALFEDKIRLLETIIDVRFVEVPNVKDAYFSYVASDLTHYRNDLESPRGKVNAFARMPNIEGSIIVADSRKRLTKSFFDMPNLTIAHELGLHHPHIEDNKPINLSENLDNFNATIMSYESSKSYSEGGFITNQVPERAPQSFQLLDIQALVDMYGLSKHRPLVERHQLGNKPEVRTLLIGQDRTQWQLAGEGGAHLNLGKTVKDVSHVNQSHYWSERPVDEITATNKQPNYYYGQQTNVTIKDGSGSSIFNASGGVDTLQTGTGKDIIQLGSTMGYTVVTDFDLTHDKIEYDSTTLKRFEVQKAPKGSHIIFYNAANRKSMIVELMGVNPAELKHADIQPIDSGELLGPYNASIMTLEKGERKKLHYLLPKQILDIESATIGRVEISFQNGQTQWKIFDDKQQAFAQMYLQGTVDLSQIIYQNAANPFSMQAGDHRVVYNGTVPSQEGVIYVGADDQSVTKIYQTATYLGFMHEGARWVLNGDLQMDKDRSHNRIFLNKDCFIDTQTKKQTPFEFLCSERTAVSHYNAQTSKIVLPAESFQTVTAHDGKCAVVGFNKNGEVTQSIFINHLIGAAEAIQIYNGNAHLSEKRTYTPLDKCSNSLKEYVKQGFEWSDQQESLAQDALNQAKWQMAAKPTQNARQR